MVDTVLSYPIFQEIILPFLLIFTIIFAILQKSKILGDGKKQIDSLVSLSIALIVVSYGAYTGVISKLMPVLAVALIVILVFLLMYGLAFINEEFKLHKGIKTAIGVIAAIVVLGALSYFTNLWGYLKVLLSGGVGDWSGSVVVANIVFIVIIIAAVFAVWKGSGKSDK
ncbi:MAG: hypothetical protein WCK90_00615 [archaeon]